MMDFETKDGKIVINDDGSMSMDKKAKDLVKDMEVPIDIKELDEKEK